MHLVSSLGRITCTFHCGGLSSSYRTTSETCHRIDLCGRKGTRTSGGLNFYTFVHVSFRRTRGFRVSICGLAGGRLRLLVTSVNLVGVCRQATLGGRFCSCHGDTLRHVGEVTRSSGLFISRRRRVHLGCTHSRFCVMSTICCCCLRRHPRTMTSVGRIAGGRRLLTSAGRLLCCRCVGNSTTLYRNRAPSRQELERFSRLCAT